MRYVAIFVGKRPEDYIAFSQGLTAQEEEQANQEMHETISGFLCNDPRETLLSATLMREKDGILETLLHICLEDQAI